MIQRTRRSLGNKKIKKVKLKTLLLLSLTLIFNTYAWFLFTSTVSTNVRVHVNAWKIQFAIDDEEVEEEFDFLVGNAYPGMSDIVKTVTINNFGEEQIDLKVEISQLRILDETYIISEIESSDSHVITSDEAIRMLQEDFPFHLNVALSDTFLDLEDSTSIEVRFSWAFSENPDQDDTEYGTRAYEFYQDSNNEGIPSISILLKLIASQHNADAGSGGETEDPIVSTP